MNPEYAKEQEEKAKKWEEDNRQANADALRRMRGLVPPNVRTVTMKDLTEKFNVPKALAKRIWDKKILWLLRTHPEETRKVHIADLTSKFSNQGLDIIEMRAIWLALPDEFDNDGDGKKADWKFNFLQKLQELTGKEDRNALSNNEKRQRAYKDVDGQELFDPDAEIVKTAALKSTAFDATEKPTDVKSSAGSIASLKKLVGKEEGTSGMLLIFSQAQGWSKQYFDLSGTKLRYFASEEDFNAQADPKHTLVLDEASYVKEKGNKKRASDVRMSDVRTSRASVAQDLGTQVCANQKPWLPSPALRSPAPSPACLLRLLPSPLRSSVSLFSFMSSLA